MEEQEGQATWGHGNGAGANRVAGTDADCGAGYVYDSRKSASLCAGAACAASASGADHSTCCVAQA